jgi:hypothetical protein
VPSSGDWNAGGNWSCGHVPGVNDTANIDTRTVHLAAAPPAVGHLSLVNGGTIAFDAAVTLTVQANTDSTTDGRFVAGSSNLDGPGTLDAEGGLARTGGNTQLQVVHGAQLTVAGVGTLDQGFVCLNSSDASLVVAGALTIADGVNASTFNCGSGTLMVAPGGVLTTTATTPVAVNNPVQNAGTITVGVGDELDLNAGLNQTGGTTYVSALSTLGGPGTKTIAGGTLTVDGTLTGTTVLTGGVLQGTGETAGVNNVSGTVKPGVSPVSATAGILHVGGAYTQGAGGTFAVSISGLKFGGDFGSMRVDGAASLAGTLALATVAPYAPTHGQFRILEPGSRTGGFDTVTGSAFTGGSYTTTYLDPDVVLEVNGGGAGCDIPWTGAAGDHDFATAGNWMSLVVPGQGDVACIPSGAGEVDFGGSPATTVAGLNILDGPAPSQFVVQSGAFTVDGALTSAGSVDLESGTLTVAGAIDTAELTVADGTLTDGADATVEHRMTWLGGTIAGNGTLSTGPGATATFDGAPLVLDGGFVNHGVLDLAGQVIVTGGGSVVNAGDGVLQKVEASPPPLGAPPVTATIAGPSIVDHGETTVSNAGLHLVEPAGQTGLIDGPVTADGELDLGGVWTVSGALDGHGALAAGFGDPVVTGDVTLTGDPFVAPHLELDVVGGSTLSLQRDGTVRQLVDTDNGGTFTGDGSHTLTAARIAILGQNDTVGGNIVILGPAVSAPNESQVGGGDTISGQIVNNGFFQLFAFSDDGPVQLTGGFVNHGVLDLAAGVAVVGGGNIENAADGTVQKVDGGGATVQGPSLHQDGTLSAAAGTLTLDTQVAGLASHTLTGGNWLVGNGGKLALRDAPIASLAAKLRLDGPNAAVTDTHGAPALAALAHVTSSGDLELGPGATLATGALANDGTVDLDHAQLTTDGDYSQTGVLHIPVSGLGAADHGHLGVGGTASLGGTLAITTEAPFAPTSGSVPIVNALSLNGTFAQVTGGEIGNGFHWADVYDIPAAEASIVVQADTGPPDDTVATLEQGTAALTAALPNWGAGFDLQPSAGFETPVVTDQLASALGTVQALQSGFANPVPSSGDDLGTILDDLEAHGAHVDWVQGGLGGRPTPPSSNDILQVETTTTLANLAKASGFTGSQFDDRMSGLLQGLASSASLDGNLGVGGSLVVHLVFGVDAQGFYVGQGTSLGLAVTADGTLGGTADLAGNSSTSLAGTGDAQLTVTLGLGSRVRPADFGADPHMLLHPTATGTAHLNVTATDDPLELNWSSTSTLTTDGVTTSVANAPTLGGTLTLPEFEADLQGSFDGTTWTLHGTGQSSSLDGISLSQLTSDATITPAGTSGSLDAVAGVDFGAGGDTQQVALHATFAGSHLHAAATVPVPDQKIDIGPASLALHGPMLTVTLDADTQGPTASLAASVHADSVTGALRGVVDFDLAGLDLHLGVAPSAHVFDAGSVTATIPSLGDVGVTLTGFHLNGDGTFGLSTVSPVVPHSLVQGVGLAGILPFDLTGVTLAFPDHENLDQLTLDVEGKFDLPAMAALPFTPEIAVGSQTANDFSFGLALGPLAQGEIRPLDFGDITLGFHDLKVGEATIGGSFTLGGYHGGVFIPSACGSLTLGGAVDVLSGNGTISVCGTLDAAAHTLQLAGTFDVSAKLGDVAEIDDAQLDFALGLAYNGGFTVTGPTLTGAHVGEVLVHAGDFMTLQATDVTIPSLDPGPGQPLVTFGGDPQHPFDHPGAAVTFDTSAAVLDGWAGAAGNFGVAADFKPILLPGFFAVAKVPDGTTLGLPSFLPLHIDELGMKLPNVDLAHLPAGGLELNDLSDFTLRVSGGLEATSQWPIAASVDGLEVDLGKLVNGQFPITNLDGFKLGIEPFELAPGFEVGGDLELKTTQVNGQDVFYGQVFGDFEYQGMGAGLDLVVSQYGPVLASIAAPVGIPIDGGLLGGVILTDVTGGVKFGGPPLPDPATPLDILHDPAFNTSFPITDATIQSAITTAVQTGTFTWGDGFTTFLGGTLTHAMAPGIVTGDVTLGMNVGFGPSAALKLIGHGDVRFYGMPFAGAALLIDLSNPTAPKFDAAYETPETGNPLNFLMPAQTDFELSIDTKGIVAGVALGLNTFVREVADGTIATGGDLFYSALDGLAARLQAEHTRPLAQLLLDVNGDGTVSTPEDARTIDRTFLVDRLLGRDGEPGLLALGADGLPADPAAASATVQALMSELLESVGEAAVSGQFGTSPVDALAAFSSTVNQAARDAGSAFESQFDPKLVLRGVIQPIIFGIPLGQPDQDVEVVLSKTGLAFGFDTSVGDISQRLANLVVPIVGGAVVNLITLGFEDRLGVTVQLPLTGVTDRLLTGQGFGPADFDPVHGDWAVDLRGGLAWNGFQVAQMNGLLFGPGDRALLDSHVQKLFLDPTQSVDPSLIPIESQQHYDDMVTHGGLLLTGRLLAPKLLTDPAALLSGLNLPFPSSDPTQIPQWVTSLGATLGQIDQPASVQLYIPGLTGLIDPNFDAPTELGRLNFTQTGATLAASLNNAFAAAYIEGTWNGKVLSVPVGNLAMSTTSNGIQMTGLIPLLGLSGTFQLDTHSTTGANGTVTLPRVATTVSLTSAQLNTALTNIGLPPVFTATTGFTATFRGFTPGYDTTSTDPLQQQGGIALDGHIGIAGLVGDGSFHFAITPPSSASVTPDFTATAMVTNLQKLAGVQIHNAQVIVTKTGTNVSVGVDGSATILGVNAHVSGTLASDLTGHLAVSFGGTPPDLGGFALQGSLQFDLTRDSKGRLVSTLDFSGLVALPAWLANASGAATVAATGTINSGGDFAFSLALSRFTFGPGGVVKIVGSNGTGPAMLDLVRSTKGVTTVAVNGMLDLGPGSGLPLFGISGSLSTAGVGPLAITFGTAGLNLSGFVVTGGASMSFNQGTFSIALNGSLTIPNVLTGAAVTGSMDQSGIQTLGVAAGSLTLPPLTLHTPSVSLGRVIGSSPAAYSLTVSTGADIPHVVSGLALNGQFNSSGFGSLNVTGTSLTLDGFTISGGTFSVVRGSSGLSFQTKGSASFLGQTLTVSQASLAIGTSGLTGNLTAALAGGAPVSVGGWNVNGAFQLVFGGATATFAISSGSVSVPGIGSLARNDPA